MPDARAWLLRMAGYAERKTAVVLHRPRWLAAADNRRIVGPVEEQRIDGTRNESFFLSYWPSWLGSPYLQLDREGCSMQVLVRDNNVDQALKVLKKKMQRERRLPRNEASTWTSRPNEI
jgi:hypothetical protein